MMKLEFLLIRFIKPLIHFIMIVVYLGSRDLRVTTLSMKRLNKKVRDTCCITTHREMLNP